MTENQNFFNFLKSHDLVLVVINNGDVLYSDKIGSYHDASLGIQSVESFLLSFLHDSNLDVGSDSSDDNRERKENPPYKHITTFQLNTDSAVVIIGKLKHSEEECMLLSILMKKLHLIPSNKTISLMIGMDWNPDEIILKQINRETFPELKQNNLESELAIPASNHKSHRSVIPLIAFALIISLVFVTQYDVLAVHYCTGIVDIAYGNLDFDTANDCNNTILKKYPDDRFANQWKPIIEDAITYLPIENRTQGSDKQLNDRADSFAISNVRSALVLYNVVYVRDNLSSRGLNGIANSLVDIDRIYLERVYNKDGFNLDPQNMTKYSVANEFYKKTERIYQKASPGNGVPNSIIGQATILFKQNDLDDALSLFNTGMDICEKESVALNGIVNEQSCFLNGNIGIGFTYLRQINYEGADQKFDLVLENDPGNLIGKTGKGFIHLFESKEDDDDDSIKSSYALFADVLEKKPILINTIVDNAVYFTDIGEYDIVNVLYHDILLEILPDDYTVLNGKGMLLLRMNGIESAIQYYDILLDKYPESNSLVVGYADVLFEQGDFDQALILYQRVLNDEPENEGAYFGIQNTKPKI